MSNEIPTAIKDKLLEMPEYRYGAHKVMVRLRNGETYHHVFIAWASEVVRVGNDSHIPFDAGDIVEIENEVMK